MKASRKIRRAARHQYHACLVDGLLDDARARTVAGLLGGSKKRGALSLLTEDQRLVPLDRARHTAVVESGAPLVADERETVRAELARKYGPHVEASFEQNPALIGGMRIRVGSNVFDNSVRAKLAALASRL